MKKNAKRILSMILVLMMFVSLMPTALAAEVGAVPYEDEGYGSSWSDWDDQPAEEIPAEDPAEEIIEEPVVVPAEEPVEEPAEEPAAEPSIELVEEPAPVLEPVDEEEPVESFPANTFFYVGGSGLRVTVEAPAGAFPEDADMTVTEKALDEVQAQIDQSDYVGQVAVVAADISFADSEGNELQPNVPVRVYMSDPYITEVEDPMVLHIADDGEVSQVGGPAADLRLEEPVAALNAMGSIQSATASVNAVSEPAASAKASSSLSLSFEASSFSTYTITWRTNTNNTVTVHYGYMDGNRFQEFSAQPSPVDNATNHHAYLIYDFEGYQYSATYYRTSTSTNPTSGSTQIQARLAYGGGNMWNYDNWRYRTVNGDSWQTIANNSHIYVIYTAKPATPKGGTAVAKLSPDTEDPAEPEVLKESTDNHDGTRTLSLSITGHTEKLEVEKLADVIVVFDISGSMNYDMDGDQTSQEADQRITIAKNAVNNMANTLLSKTNSSGGKLIRMALISFSTSAKLEQGFTDSYSTFSTAVNNLGTGGGTNWEYGLQLANQMGVDSERATFVIFVSDGDPTFRVSRMNANNAGLDVYGKDGNDNYYVANNVFGEGSADSYSRNYNAALNQAKSIVGLNKNFYTIGISNDVSNMAKLNREAGGKGNYTATSAADLEKAFNAIIASIEGSLGWSANIDDGVTGLTNLSAKTAIVGVDEKSFKYYKNGVEWDPTSEGAKEAVYNTETGAVQWDLGTNFQLENGVTYKVSFLVWPSQAATDYVTQLNNGEIEYDDLEESVRAQIKETSAGSGTYVLRTNTQDAHVTYQESTKVGSTVTPVGEVKTAMFNEVDPLGLNTMKLKIAKIFTDSYNPEDRDIIVHLYLERREVKGNDQYGEWEDFAVPYIKPDGSTAHSNIIELSEGNDWTAEFFISPGLIANGTTYNQGYEFRVTEPNLDYHYELNGEIVKPMMVDNEASYIGDTDDNQMLTAENIVKGGIRVDKIVVDDKGIKLNDDGEYTIAGSILGPDGQPFTFDPAWDDREDKSSKEGSDTWKAHMDDPGAYHLYDIDGTTRIGYKLHFASTGEIELKLKPGMYAYFINVPQNCTYEFHEVTTGMPVGVSFDSIEASAYVRDGDTHIAEGVEQPIPNGNSVTGKTAGNTEQWIDFYNVSSRGEPFFVYHSSDNTIEKIYSGDSRVTGKTLNPEKDGYIYTFNIVDETKAGFLYGGYFMNTTKTVTYTNSNKEKIEKSVTSKGYYGAALTDAEIIKLDYAEKSGKTDLTYVAAGHEGGYWAKDENGNPYTGEAASQWAVGAAQTTKGTAMQAVSNGVYYLKEVPEQYFRPALYYVYDERTENKDVKKLYLLVPVDDGIYQFVNGKPIELTNGTSLYSIFKVTDFFGNEKSLTVVDANENLKRGFLVVWDRADLIKADTYKWTPNFTTKDGVLVTAIAERSFGFDSGLGFQYLHDNCEDVRVASTYA